MSNGEKNNLKQVDILLTNISGQKPSEKKSFVVPGQICVSPGDTVQFSALETRAKLLFPNKDLLHPKYHAQDLKSDFIEIESGDPYEITISPEVEPGAYSFVVITTANNDLASGGSFPRFIVD